MQSCLVTFVGLTGGFVECHVQSWIGSMFQHLPYFSTYIGFISTTISTKVSWTYELWLRHKLRFFVLEGWPDHSRCTNSKFINWYKRFCDLARLAIHPSRKKMQFNFCCVCVEIWVIYSILLCYQYPPTILSP